MIRLTLINNDYKYEIENIIQLFYPQEHVSPDEGDFAAVTAACDGLKLSVTVEKNGQLHTRNDTASAEHECERILCALLFDILHLLTGIRPAWGIQTGVRPTKLLRNLTEQLGVEGAERYFREKLLVSEEKLSLARSAMSAQQPFLARQAKNSYSLYISVPFCPSRCSYCSFVSHDIKAAQKLIPEYVRLLCREIEYTAEVMRSLSMHLQTVYIGGGTPTALSAEQLEAIMDSVVANFDMSAVEEFTVEAGRPDTVTVDKLAAIKRGGATRISINPQTLNDNVLRTIRRNHTAQQFFDAYNAAVRSGFDNINTDLIAGLPDDTLPSFMSTVDGIIDLAPKCVTVHTLSVKRPSRLVYTGQAQYSADGGDISQMLGYSQKMLVGSGYKPYYMYRQSRMAGNNENIGWSQPGFEGLYNIYIMEEQQSIVALGAGGSTKLVSDGGKRIERIFNYKYHYEYIKGFDEILRRKDKIKDFYA